MWKRTRLRNQKYNAQAVVDADGVRHASKKEARRWAELCLLQKAGVIRDLRRQVSFDFAYNGVKLCSYRADFVYTDGFGHAVVEDAKGYKPPMYLLKRKMMKAWYGVTVLET
jgi:hypothetical protein